MAIPESWEKVCVYLNWIDRPYFGYRNVFSLLSLFGSRASKDGQ